MRWKTDWKPFAILTGVFLAVYFLPVGRPRFDRAILEALHLARWYAREHVLLCLVPAFFIAGAIAVFVSESSVIKYLGSKANKGLAYGVASVSGTILAVCSCTVLPLFAGIYRMGAGLGPATAFLYSGPAINVLAIILTARVLGPQLGLARALGAIVFAVVIGVAMELLFARDEAARSAKEIVLPVEEASRPLWQNMIYFAALVAILVFANWGEPASGDGLWAWIWAHKWLATAGAALALTLALVAWFGLGRGRALLGLGLVAGAALMFPRTPLVPFAVGSLVLVVLTSRDDGELGQWFDASWGFARQILPLLLAGVLVAGALLGRPGGEGLIPSAWVAAAVGGNSVGANLFAAVAGAFMYFATLTEIPILQGLIANGMGPGPALALLLAGPALSLPNMLVIASVIGWKKTSAYIVLTIVMATFSGWVYGSLFL